MSFVKTGFLTAFDGSTLVNHSAYYALSFARVDMIVQNKTYVLPNGTKLNYDASTDSTVTPGTARQEVHYATSGYSVAGAIEAKLGNIGTLTHTDLASTAKACTAILTKAQRIGVSAIGDRAVMQMEYEFDLVTDWA